MDDEFRKNIEYDNHVSWSSDPVRLESHSAIYCCTPGPFKNATFSSNTMVNERQYWLSTKPIDNETGLYYYGYRYYHPEEGRWISRDPIGERGGRNLYGWCRNGGINRWDAKGLVDNDILVPGDPPPVDWGLTPPKINAPEKGENNKRLGGRGYTWFPSCCTKKNKRLSPIPEVVQKLQKDRMPLTPVGGQHEIYPYPNNPPSAVGSDGALTCYILVVKCPALVAVFHFTGGDSPASTLNKWIWPSGCSSIMCGGKNDDDQSNCLGDDVKDAVNAKGLNLVGVSGSQGCGVDADGKWYQTQ